MYSNFSSLDGIKLYVKIKIYQMISDIIQIFEWFFTWLNHVNLNVQVVDGVKIRSGPSRIDLRCEKCVGPTPCRIVPLWNRCS